jgi:hypothetical protein
MISSGTYKREAALNMIAGFFSANGRTVSTEFACDGMLYLDGGQWRLWESEETSGIFVLKHVDRTPQELAIVEQAICIIFGLKYVEPGE